MKRTALGFPHRVPAWMAARRRLGEALSPPERGQMVAALADAQSKMAAVRAWADAQRDLDASLGGDASRFRTLKGLVDSEAGGAVAAFVQLQRPDPADWDISAWRTDADAFVAGANELSEIVRRAAPDKWGPLLQAIVGGALSLVPGILAPGPAAGPPATVPPKPPTKPSEDWPWWAYGLAGAGGLILLGGAIALLAPKAAPAPAAAAPKREPRYA
jgi:hypothetical protein